MTCLVHGCKLDYSAKGEYVHVFSNLTDNKTSEKWFQAIHRQREDYEMNRRLRVISYIIRFPII